MKGNLAILMMAYGTPSSEDDIEPYLTDIRHGQKPTLDMVENLRERYRKIGGKSPLEDITSAQASALESALRSENIEAPVFFAMKHWHPYAREVVPKILDAGYLRILGIALAPYYSGISIGGYKQALQSTLEGTPDVSVDFVDSWYDNPLFHSAVAERITDAVKRFQDSANVHVLFTAHSLPERILQNKDPYPEQLAYSCQAVANLLNLRDWSFAYQSAGHTKEKWLGPDILEALDKLTLRSTPPPDVLVVPIGFVADHLEILYDVDVEAQEFAQNRGLTLMRTESLNTSPIFISALSDIIKGRLVKS